MEHREPTRSPSKQIAALIFTDLVGSVALQQKLGTNAYTRYVGRHDEIIKQCLAATPDARILNETGDGFLIRFTDPCDAVNTALRLQYHLSRERFEGEAINIRMGLNMGLITEMNETNRGGTRAVGMPINLVARIMDLGGAGQILMTRSVYDDAKQFVRQHPESTHSDSLLAPPEWVSHGAYEIDGNDKNIEIFEIGLPGIAPLSAPAGSKKARPASNEQSTSAGIPAAAKKQENEPLDIENSDVIISYAEVDNEPLRSGEDGWISQLQRNLKVRMEQLSGEDVKISRLSGQAFESNTAGGTVLREMNEAKAVVPVISPPFSNSPGCQKEMEIFCDPANTQSHAIASNRTSSKLVNAIKMPVHEEQLPNSISSVISRSPGLEFFEREPDTGRAREFHESFGEDSRQRYYERVYDLAHELCEKLKSEKRTTSSEPSETTDDRQRIFLAPTTSELTIEYDIVKRELKEHNYHVVPESPLPYSLTELNSTLEELLEGCVTSIHLMGHNYGLIPEGSSSSLGEILLRFTAEKASEGLKRFIWSPRELADGDTRQVELLERVQEDPALHSAAELIEGSIATLKRDIFRVIEEKQKETDQKAESKTTSGNHSKLVYLICEQRDEEAVEQLEDFLFQRGLEVCLPAFDGDEAEVKALHQENLINCSGALVYYGAAPRAWVDIKLRELIKAVGYGREKPIENQAVFIAPPSDNRKNRYKSHTAKIIRQGGDSFAPDSELKEFVEAMLKI